MRRLLLLLAFTLLPALAWGQADSDPQAPLPALVPDSNSYTSVRSFLRDEDANRFAEMFNGFVVGGCLHGTAGGKTGTFGVTPCVAYPGGWRVSEPAAAINYNTQGVVGTSGLCWVVATRDASGSVGVFQRVSGTHYATNCVAATQPDLPANAVYLMRVTISGGAITLVADLRTMNPVRGPPGAKNVMDCGATGDGVTDDTAAIQRCIDQAALDRVVVTWTNEPIHAVFFPGVAAGYLIRGNLVAPEGVVWKGESVYGSRLFLAKDNWTAGVPKVRDANFTGTAPVTGPQENFGFEDLTFMLDPHDPDGAHQLSGVAMIELRRTTEAHFKRVRFLVHTYVSAFPPYNITVGDPSTGYEADGVTAIKLGESVATEIESCGFDRGYGGIIAKKVASGDNTNGCAFCRIHDNYLYNQSGYSIDLGALSYNTTVSDNVMDEPRGSPSGPTLALWLEDDGAGGSAANTIIGNTIRATHEALTIDGWENVVVGNSMRTTQTEPAAKIGGSLNTFTGNRVRVDPASVYDIEVTGRSNQIVGNALHGENGNRIGQVTDAAVDNILVNQDYTQFAGEQHFRTRDRDMTDATTWYDYANIHMPHDYTGAMVTVSLNMLLNSIGMKGLRQVWYISRETGALTAVESAPDKIESGACGDIECQWVTNADNFDMKLQCRRLTGTTAVSTASVIVDVIGMAQGSRQYPFLLTDLTR